MTAFEKDSYVWIPDEKECYLPAKVIDSFSSGKAGTVRVLAPGADQSSPDLTRKIDASASSQVLRMDPELAGKDTFPDMVKLHDLNEPSILHNLRSRFKSDEIYTGIGDVLVSVNPFKQLPLYSPDLLDNYITTSTSTLPPHIFGVGARSYRSMVEDREDQSCLISGESGAGKSEAAKVYMQFLAEISASRAQQQEASGAHRRGQSLDPALAMAKSAAAEDPNSIESTRRDAEILQEKILKAAPVLESFGNAKTVRNKNSSRFGKWIEIRFQPGLGTIKGATIIQYLLEKTRITNQSEGERNYHIFYQICAAATADPEFKKKFRLTEADQYAYLEGLYSGSNSAGGGGKKDGKAAASNDINDERAYFEMYDAMVVLGLSQSERDDIFRTVAGVLQLGNIDFEADPNAKGGEEVARVATRSYLDLVAFQFGVKPEALEKCLISMDLISGKEKITQLFTVARAREIRNVLARAIYGNLFEFIVERLNVSLNISEKVLKSSGSTVNVLQLLHQNNLESVDAKTGKKLTSMIGILDIFGFESFLKNSFEQLCINYCNERLQSYFTEYVFRLEQDEYKLEEVNVGTINYVDNKHILDMIDAPRAGVFGMLDEEGNIPRGSDETLLRKLATKFEKGTNFVAPGPKVGKNTFGIVHYAGEVLYDITGFIAKNKDTLPGDIVEMARGSTSKLIPILFHPDEPHAGGAPAAGRMSVAPSAGTSKKTLGYKFKSQLDTLVASISTTKPHFIRCIKPNNLLQSDIFQGPMVLAQLRYSGLLEVSKIRQQGYPSRKHHKYFTWRFRPLLAKKDKEAWSACSRQAVDKDPRGCARICAQAIVKLGVMQPTDWLDGKTKILLRASANDKMESARIDAISFVLTKAQAVARGKIARRKYKAIAGILTKLDKAVKMRDLKMIEERMQLVAELPHGGLHLAQVKNAIKVKRELEAENRLIEMLDKALAKPTIDVLDSAVDTVATAGKTSVLSPVLVGLLDKARALSKDMKAQKEALELLVSAISKRDLKMLTTAISKTPPALHTSSEYKQASSLKARIDQELGSIANLEKAIKSKNTTEIKQCVDIVVDLGLGSHEIVAKAKKLVQVDEQRLQARAKEADATKLELKSAADARDMNRLTEGKKKALELGIPATDPAVAAAFKVLDALIKEKEWKDKISAISGGLLVATKRSEGIKESDIAPLDSVIRDAVKNGFKPESFEELQRATKFAESARIQIKLQVELSALVDAFKKGTAGNKKAKYDTTKLVEAIQRADNINMKSVLCAEEARECLRKATQMNDELYEVQMAANIAAAQKDAAATGASAANPAGHVSSLQAVPEDEIENKLSEQLDKASQPAYHFTNYHRIRSDMDFNRGIMFSKDKSSERKLKFQDTAIHKSILTLNDENSRQATKIHKSILGYSGDIMMSYPAQLAQGVVSKALENPALADEIYMQLMKQITGNQSQQSIARLWHLICICVGCFPPSQPFELYLINFLLAFGQVDSMIGKYAEYALRRLHGTMLHGAIDAAPPLHEIAPFADRPPVLATIEIVDGTAIAYDFPVAPHMNVDHILRICTEFLAINDARAELFGMFVTEKNHISRTLREKRQSVTNAGASTGLDSDMPPPPPFEDDMDIPPPPPPADDDIPPPPPISELTEFASRSPYPLQSSDFMGDIVLKLSRSGKDEKFVFKKKLFLPEKSPLGKDPVYNRLVYLQALDEIVTGNWKLEKETSVIEIATIALMIDLQPKFPAKESELLAEGMMDYLPITWRSKSSPQNWAAQILKKRAEIGKAPVDELQLLFMSIASELPMYGMACYFARKTEHGDDLVCGIDCRGIHVFSLTRELQTTVLYKQMEKYGGSSTRLVVRLTDGKGELVLWTSQAREIAALIMSYTQYMAEAG